MTHKIKWVGSSKFAKDVRIQGLSWEAYKPSFIDTEEFAIDEKEITPSEFRVEPLGNGRFKVTIELITDELDLTLDGKNVKYQR